MRIIKTCDFARALKIGDTVVYKRVHPLKKKVSVLKGEVVDIYPYFILLKVRKNKVCIHRIPTVYESIRIICSKETQ